MIWIVLALVLAALLAAASMPKSPVRVYSSIRPVRLGKVGHLRAAKPMFTSELVTELARSMPAAGESAPPSLAARPARRRGSLGDTATPVALAGAVGAYDWLTPDPRVLGAMSQMSHANVNSTLDLWHEVHDHSYHLLSESSLYKWRGTVGEQDVYNDLHSWLGDRVHLWTDSNHPGSDFTLDGHEFNVKVTADAARTATEHFSKYPHIPIVLNSDAAHIPPDAIHVDLSQPFDPSILEGHSVIVADGLTLSGMEDALHSTFGDTVGGHLDATGVLGNLSDAGVPVIGTAIRIIRSGMREGKLVGVHNSKARMAANIATDVTVVGTGVWGGITAGSALGAQIDLASGGLTLGLGTVGGMMLGALGGSKGGRKVAEHIRYRRLRTAQQVSRTALERYLTAAEGVEEETHARWEEAATDAQQAAAQARAELAQVVSTISEHLHQDIACTDLLGVEPLRLRLDDAFDRVDRAESSEGSRLVRRRAAAWRTFARTAKEPIEILDALYAAAGGVREVKKLLNEVSARRGHIAAASIAGFDGASSTAAMYASRLNAELAATRGQLQTTIKQILDPLASALDDANAQLVNEAAATGQPITLALSE